MLRFMFVTRSGNVRPFLLALTLIVLLLYVCSGISVSAADERDYIKLARDAVVAEVKGKEPPVLSKKTPPKPVFVTIEIKGKVAGCRGSLQTRYASLEEEIIQAARAAARHDPRYPPLQPKDLAGFLVTVTIVEKMDPLDDIDTLTPADGLVLKSGAKVGVVLPWEGKDPRVRLEWAYRKAGVRPDTQCQIYRLKAERYRG